MPAKRALSAIALILVLSGCGSDGSNPPAASTPPVGDAQAQQPAPAPAPGPTPSPAPAPVDAYAGGTRYPAAANVSLESFEVPAGAMQIHVPVRLDRESPNTVVAHVRVTNGNGGRARPDTVKSVVFRPGDPLVKTVPFDVSSMSEGNTVFALQPEVPAGANRVEGKATVTARAGSVNAPMAGGRAPLQFEPHGSLVYEVDGSTIRFDDSGGPDTFSTALPHGRTQTANAETGYYGPASMGGFERTPEGLVLKSFRLPEPVSSGGTQYPFLSAILSGHRMETAVFRYGSIEWVARMPNRRGTWPALWLVSKAGWPPEIDVYEGFGYNNSWRFASDLSTNLHGGRNNQRTFTRLAMTMKMSDFGLANTLDSEFHRFACTVTPEWITIYVDGVETMRYANPFPGTTWYPLAQIATKVGLSDPYDQGKGTLELRSLKVWRAE